MPTSTTNPPASDRVGDGPLVDHGGDGDDKHNQPFPTNSYVTRKTVAQGALDFALLMANASQLKALVDIPENSRGQFYVGLLVLLGMSISLQIAAGLVLLVLGMMDPDKGESVVKRAERLNNASVCIILIITIFNVCISAFSISYVDNMAPGATTTITPSPSP